MAVEAKVVQPHDRRPLVFTIKEANLDYDLDDVIVLTVRRIGPSNAIRDDLLADGLIELDVEKLIVRPDLDYWDDDLEEGMYRFAFLIQDPVDITITHLVPSDPRKMEEVQLVNPTLLA